MEHDQQANDKQNTKQYVHQHNHQSNTNTNNTIELSQQQIEQFELLIVHVQHCSNISTQELFTKTSIQYEVKQAKQQVSMHIYLETQNNHHKTKDRTRQEYMKSINCNKQKRYCQRRDTTDYHVSIILTNIQTKYIRHTQSCIHTQTEITNKLLYLIFISVSIYICI
jgi:hypothetical protein